MAEPANDADAKKALVLKFMTSAQAGDLETMVSCITEDYVQTFPRPGLAGMPAGAEGRDQLVEFLNHLPVYEKGSMKMTVENLIVEGSTAAIQFKMNAVTARGEPYENFYCQFFEFRGDKIAKAWEYCDTLYGAKKLMPEALAAPAK